MLKGLSPTDTFVFVVVTLLHVCLLCAMEGCVKGTYLDTLIVILTLIVFLPLQRGMEEQMLMSEGSEGWASDFGSEEDDDEVCLSSRKTKNNSLSGVRCAAEK